ncbi:glutaredoxin family protein [Planctomicrobium sp. SH661]|uniref:glutaredoxin family protein n=1 Tax=Planctomicrobium sp. SH661 TaxID=3448124 RepID=UPI003F5AE435
MPASPSNSTRVFLGSTLLILGVIGGFLWLASELQGLPAALERFIRGNSAIWALGCVVSMIVGIRLLWQAGHRRAAWRPTRPGIRFRTVIVYSRPDCPLCEDAMETLAEYRQWVPVPSEVNIDEDPELLERFDETVPVVEIDGRVRFRGSINDVLLRRLIEGTMPQSRLRHR